MHVVCLNSVGFSSANLPFSNIRPPSGAMWHSHFGTPLAFLGKENLRSGLHCRAGAEETLWCQKRVDHPSKPLLGQLSCAPCSAHQPTCTSAVVNSCSTKDHSGRLEIPSAEVRALRRLADPGAFAANRTQPVRSTAFLVCGER